MASYKVEICVNKKTHPEHKYSVTFVLKVGTIRMFSFCVSLNVTLVNYTSGAKMERGQRKTSDFE